MINSLIHNNVQAIVGRVWDEFRNWLISALEREPSPLSIADWTAEAHSLARLHAYRKVDGTPVIDGDTLDDAHFTAASGAVKLQLKG